MEVKVLSRPAFNRLMDKNGVYDDTVEKFDKAFFISINDTSDLRLGVNRTHFKREHPNVKILYFDDVEKEGETSPTNPYRCEPFSEKQAEELLDFIESNSDKLQCFVHCMAGISRSGAVGAFVNDFFGGRYSDFVADNPQVLPNARVTRMLNAERRARE
jgi:predicted protein tyrosine phosphatase